eukprot:3727772-Ditylum_brightwellii.AAC.1
MDCFVNGLDVSPTSTKIGVVGEDHVQSDVNVFRIICVHFGPLCFAVVLDKVRFAVTLKLDRTRNDPSIKQRI